MSSRKRQPWGRFGRGFRHGQVYDECASLHGLNPLHSRSPTHTCCRERPPRMPCSATPAAAAARCGKTRGCRIRGGKVLFSRREIVVSFATLESNIYIIKQDKNIAAGSRRAALNGFVHQPCWAQCTVPLPTGGRYKLLFLFFFVR